MRAAPWNTCAAICSATWRGSPIITPPSAIASIITYTKAGPLPPRLVTASITLSSTPMQRPPVSNSPVAAATAGPPTPRPRASTVMPSPIRHGVLGIARITADSGNHPASCVSVTPAAMLITSLPASASRMPG